MLAKKQPDTLLVAVQARAFLDHARRVRPWQPVIDLDHPEASRGHLELGVIDPDLDTERDVGRPNLRQHLAGQRIVQRH